MIKILNNSDTLKPSVTMTCGLEIAQYLTALKTDSSTKFQSQELVPTVVGFRTYFLNLLNHLQNRKSSSGQIEYVEFRNQVMWSESECSLSIGHGSMLFSSARMSLVYQYTTFSARTFKNDGNHFYKKTILLLITLIIFTATGC